MNSKTNKLVKISLLSALSLILMYIDFPIIPAFPWLKIDLSDVPALLGAFGFGPLAGVIIELIKNILYILVKGTQTGLVGECANFLVGISLILPASFLYTRKKSKKTAILGMILGAVCMQIIGIIANVYFLLPAYGMAMSTSDTINYVTLGLLPFNGIKSILVCVSTYFLYKRISVAVFKTQSNFDSKSKKQEIA